MMQQSSYRLQKGSVFQQMPFHSLSFFLSFAPLSAFKQPDRMPLPPLSGRRGLTWTLQPRAVYVKVGCRELFKLSISAVITRRRAPESIKTVVNCQSSRCNKCCGPLTDVAGIISVWVQMLPVPLGYRPLWAMSIGSIVSMAEAIERNCCGLSL